MRTRVFGRVLRRKQKSERNFIEKHEVFMKKLKEINELRLKSESRAGQKIYLK